MAAGAKQAIERPAGLHLDTDAFFFAERVLALLLIAIVALWLRAQNPGYTTAYIDESIYVVYGRMFLGRHFEAPLATPLRWSFGWYLWPALAAVADRLGGIVALREMAAAMGTAAVMAVYGFSRRLYGNPVGVGTAAVFAVLGPAVMVSRIATRDTGSFFFFALGLWAFVRAWQEDEVRSWLMAAVCLFSAFLCKYIVAIYFPFLVIFALWKGHRAALSFCLPMVAAAGLYLFREWPDLKYLLLYGRSYGSLYAHGWQLWNVYVGQRIDLWVIALLAILAFVVRGHRAVTSILWLGAALTLAFQWKTRADFDFWKHATYVLLFLAPAAVYALVGLTKRTGGTPLRQSVIAILAVLALAAGVARAGKTVLYDETVFWPNVQPVLSYFEGRLPNNAQVLTDDSVLRYYFNPMLSQSQITDPFYVQYQGHTEASAYGSAVENGRFDYVILDGGMGEEPRAMESALWGHLGRYTLVLQTPDPTLGHTIQIYQRTSPPAQTIPAGSASVNIVAPRSESLVNRSSEIAGNTSGAANGWYVRLEVFTDRWYSMGSYSLRQDGTFEVQANFSGEGNQACHHMVRARLYDAQGAPRAVSIIFNVKRSDQSCP
jgi:Dolichyl-phosphate-mannose-protein mannosyltransferase